jgi:hypothetical protein
LTKEAIGVRGGDAARHSNRQDGQGGDTWRSVFNEACRKLVKDPETEATQKDVDRIAFDSDKAGAGHGSKVHRNSHMLSDYERGRFIHVEGTHKVLERALKRFPRTKPLDLADAAYWSWYDLDSGPKDAGSGWGGF